MRQFILIFGDQRGTQKLAFLNVLIGYYKLKKTLLKNIQEEPNDVIFKMAEFATFTTKMQKI